MSRDGGLAHAGGSEQECAGAEVDSPAEESIELGNIALENAAGVLELLGRDESGIHHDPAGLDGEIMPAVAEGDAAELDDLEARLAVPYPEVVRWSERTP